MNDALRPLLHSLAAATAIAAAAVLALMATPSRGDIWTTTTRTASGTSIKKYADQRGGGLPRRGRSGLHGGIRPGLDRRY